MQFGNLPFMTTDWSTIPATEHPGAWGTAVWHTVEAGNVRVRMVEYSPGYVADHWCSRGHVLLVLEGRLVTELKDGRVVRLTPGMSYQVANDTSPHYPVWWSDCPAKLKGWFDRVLTYGYAYVHDGKVSRGTRMSVKKALALCPAGHTVEHLEETGIADSMRRVMLNDRLLGVGVKQAHMEILGGMTPPDDRRREWNLRRAYELGRTF